jgi:hypothetical protein
MKEKKDISELLYKKKRMDLTFYVLGLIFYIGIVGIGWWLILWILLHSIFSF